MTTNIQNIIKYWKLAEKLTPPKVETKDKSKLNCLKSIQHIILRDKDKNIPWLNQTEFKHFKNEESVWSYRVFLGIVDVNNVNEMVNDIFGGEFDTNLSKPDFYSCIACFKVGFDGTIKEDSLEIPDYFTSISNLKEIGPDNDSWVIDDLGIRSKMEKAFSNFCDLNKDKILKYKDFKEILSDFLEISKWPTNFTQSLAVIHSYNFKVPKKQKSEKEIIRIEGKEDKDDKKDEDLDANVILNSFFFDDLSFIEAEISKDKSLISKALKDYLSITNPKKRIDLVQDKSHIKEYTSPSLMASAKWPGVCNYSLSLAQQVCVNLALKEEKGIFSVNGPPGTGKTTLLRDIISNIVVQRAIKMLDLDDPEDAYTNKTKFKLDNREYNCYKIIEELRGYEIFVASSNNAAVENITKEIPRKSEIDKSFEIDYFSDIATNILGEDSWGLGAAVLGSKTKRNNFFHKLWFEKSSSEKEFNLKKYLQNKAKNIDWNESKKKFSDKLNQFKNLQSKLIDLEKIINTISSKVDSLKFLNKKIEDLSHNKANSKTKILKLKKEIKNIKSKIFSQNNLQSSLLTTKSNFIIRILSLFQDNEYSDWKIKNKKITDRLFELDEEKEELEKQLYLKEDDIEEFENNIKINFKKAEKLKIEIEDDQKTIMNFKNKIGKNFPDSDFWDQKDESLQILNPWLFEELERLRAGLFIEAMNLHKSFIINSNDKFISNINSVSILMQGKLSQDVKDYISCLWTTLSITVPVFSTTFASFSSLCKGLFKEDIGYLLIDEAGQAVPHAAAGAIYRSKKTIIVGDPMQIEPVFEISEVMSKSLMKFCKITQEFDICQNSVQDLADRNNIYGTYIKINDIKKWVGCPLRVHRRCEDPMFSISNKIAYNNLMIQATNNKKIAVGNIFPKSHWFDIESEFSDSHYIEEEGKKAQQIIERIISETGELPSIYIISPFRNVSFNFQNLLKRNIYKWNQIIKNKSKIENWINKNIGTIHTFQGKQAEVVILLLGGNPSKEGAITWASKTPNMLNVAVTRAKNLLFIVGSKKRWSKKPNFSVLNNYINFKT